LRNATDQPFMNIAHRGASGYRPENTLSAFCLAIKMGATHLECDVRLTRDREIVVIHDSTVDRTTNGTGAVSEIKLSELKKLDAGSWFGEQFGGDQIPTLQEVFQVMGEETGLVIEIKDGANLSEIVEQTVAKVRQRRLIGQAGISSFDWVVLEKVKELAPEIETSVLVVLTQEPGVEHRCHDRQPVYCRVDQLIKDVERIGADIICPPAQVVTPTLVREIHSAGFPVRVWGLPKEKDFEKVRYLISCGVNGMTINYPDILRDIWHNEYGTNASAGKGDGT